MQLSKNIYFTSAQISTSSSKQVFIQFSLTFFLEHCPLFFFLIHFLVFHLSVFGFKHSQAVQNSFNPKKIHTYNVANCINIFYGLINRWKQLIFWFEFQLKLFKTSKRILPLSICGLNSIEVYNQERAMMAHVWYLVYHTVPVPAGIPAA